MNVLCFDIASGGLTAALFDQNLAASNVVDIPWEITLQPDGSAVLPVSVFAAAFLRAVSQLPMADAVSFSGFMHNLVLLDREDQPLTDIFTWMDRRGTEGVERLRSEFGNDFHARTGCRFHPMFPVFKLASQRPAGVSRVASAKSLAIAWLTGSWIEDHGTASATGLYNVRSADWDDVIMQSIGVNSSTLPALVQREAVVGQVTDKSASRYGLRAGMPVVAGSGDGFLATIGSGCERPGQVAASLGTSAGVRHMVRVPVLDENAGTFCYRADGSSFLLGCASSNGGNVLDWARSTFGNLPDTFTNRDLPMFVPYLHGERSPQWDSSLTASWHGVTSQHSARDLAHAVIEGIVFNLACYVEILETASGQSATEIILSGNGFLAPLTASTLAAALDVKVLQPPDQGQATLRGAAVCGFRALGVDPSSGLDRLVAEAKLVAAEDSVEIRKRYRRFRDHLC